MTKREVELKIKELQSEIKDCEARLKTWGKDDTFPKIAMRYHLGDDSYHLIVTLPDGSEGHVPMYRL